jgi:hypothetical protein
MRDSRHASSATRTRDATGPRARLGAIRARSLDCPVVLLLAILASGRGRGPEVLIGCSPPPSRANVFP